MLYLLSLQHDHSFIWIFHARNIENEGTYIVFIEKTNAQLSHHLNDPERFELVKFMLTLGLARNITEMNVASPMVDILLRRQLFQKHLFLNLAMTKIKRF